MDEIEANKVRSALRALRAYSPEREDTNADSQWAKRGPNGEVLIDASVRDRDPKVLKASRDVRNNMKETDIEALEERLLQGGR